MHSGWASNHTGVTLGKPIRSKEFFAINQLQNGKIRKNS